MLGGRIADLSGLDQEFLKRLARTPSAGLGTSRLRPTDGQLDAIIRQLAAREVGAVIGIGGNDTADSLLRLEQRAKETGSTIRVIGIPKTIDNDLAVTDHSLGFPSAARVIAAATRDAMVDTQATAALYPVKLIEVMGRNAGWLAAAGSLWAPTELPLPTIALPERPFESRDRFLAHIQRRVDNDGFAVAVVPETMRWADGAHVAGDTPEWVDAFGHSYFPSAGQALMSACGVELGLRAKLDRPGSVSRASIDYASRVDLEEAEAAGLFAVESLASGDSGSCVVIRRTSRQPYRSGMELAPLESIANIEAKIPDEYIDGERTLSTAFFDYALPLVGPSTTDYVFIPWAVEG